MYNRMVVVKCRRKGKSDRFFFSKWFVYLKLGSSKGEKVGANLIVPGRTAESEYEQYRKQ